MRQCFADEISRSLLWDHKDPVSKIARGLFPIDIIEAQGLKKATNGRVNTIEDVVYFFVEREAYVVQGLEEAVEEIDR